MNKNLRWAAMGIATLALGFSMPSCPGQQAVQQQVDSLVTANAAMTKKVQELDAQVRDLNKDMNNAKDIFGQMNNAIQAQKAALDQLDVAFKASQAPKTAAKSAPTAKGKKKK